jgi:hypothetical protein
MDEGLVFPDLTKPLTKQLKTEQTKVDKVYAPFLLKFFGAQGTFTNTLKSMNNMLITRFTRLLEIMEGIYDGTKTNNGIIKKGQEPEGDKKKQHWIIDKWQKIIKLGFFQKALGFLKGMATTSFITDIIIFLVLLKMGILQRFVPFLLNTVASAIVSIIKFLPALAKMFWNILTQTLPKILKEIFHTIFKTLGIENQALLKFADLIAQWLPLLSAGAFVIFKLMPIIKFLIAGVKTIFLIVKIIGGILAGISATALIIIGIVVLIGILIYKYWDKIKPIFIGIWEAIQPAVIFLKDIALQLWDILKLVWKDIQPAFTFLKDIALQLWDILKLAWAAIQSLFGYISELFSTIGSLFVWAWNMMKPIFSMIFDTFSKIYNGILKPVFSFVWTISTIISKVFLGIIKFLFKILSPIIKILFIIAKILLKIIIPLVKFVFNIFIGGFKMLFSIFDKLIISPLTSIFEGIKKLASPIVDKVAPIFKSIGGFFTMIGDGVVGIIEKVKTTLDSLLGWFSNLGAYGLTTWLTMDQGKKQKILKAQAEQSKSVMGQVLENEAVLEDTTFLREHDLGSEDVKGIRNRLKELNAAYDARGSEFEDFSKNQYFAHLRAMGPQAGQQTQAIKLIEETQSFTFNNDRFNNTMMKTK